MQENILKEIQNSKVEWKELGEVASYEQPTKYLVKSTKYKDEFKIPVLTAGKTFILGFTDEEEGIYPASENPVIIFDDFTTANKWVDFDFKAKSSAMKILSSKNEKEVLLKYIYYFLNTLPSETSESDHKRQWISTFSKKKIPLPSLELQNKIVEILDKFTLLLSELKKELQLRKKQYEFYREKLLSFGDEVEWKTLGEIFDINAGGDAPKDSFSKIKTEEFNVPILSNGIGDNSLYGWTSKAKIYLPSLTISARGTIGWTSYRDVPFFPIVRLLVLTPKINLNLKYAYFFMKIIENNYKIPKTGIPQLTKPMLKNIKIPLPSLEKQKEIVEILDKFETLTNSIKEGLPREIELRQKQYEYYRNLLLTFKS